MRAETAQLTEAGQPVFDGQSYQQVGQALIRAAGERPQLGLKLGARTRAGEVPPYWYIGTMLASRPGAHDSDVRFSAYTPLMSDLAVRMTSGEFGSWVDGVAGKYEAGALHRVARPNGAGVQLASARMELASQATADGLYDKPAAAPSLEGPHRPAIDVGVLRFAEVESAAPVLRSRHR